MPACAGSKMAANIALKNMKAKDFYTDEVQIAFVESVGKKDVARMSEWLARGGDVNAVGKEEMHPLFWAMSKKSLVGFEFLLENGANPEASVSSLDGKFTTNIYDWALGADDPSYLKLLLKHGMDPNRPIAFAGNTVMDTAILHNRMNQVRLLVEAGANLNHQDGSGITPAKNAATVHNYTMVLFFLENGADPTLKNKWGYDLVSHIERFGYRGAYRGKQNRKDYDKVVKYLKNRELLEENFDPWFVENKAKGKTEIITYEDRPEWWPDFPKK